MVEDWILRSDAYHRRFTTSLYAVQTEDQWWTVSLSCKALLMKLQAVNDEWDGMAQPVVAC